MREGYLVFIKKVKVNSYRGLEDLEINFFQPSYEYFGNLRISIVVGENGVGKSSLFKFLANKLSLTKFRQDSLQPEGEIEYEMNGDFFQYKNTSEYPEIYPKKIIVSSFSAFDPYDIYGMQKNIDNENQLSYSKYIYLGPSDRGFSSLENVIEAIIELLFTLSNRKEKFYSYYNLLNKIKVERAEGISIDLYNLRKLRDKIRNVNNDDNVENFIKVLNVLEEKINNIRKVISNRTFKLYNIKYRYTIIPMDIFVHEILSIYKEYASHEFSIPIIKDIVFLNKTGSNVLLSELSSGEITMLFRFLPLVKEIEDNSIILIDEPETHLHPKWTREFISYLESLFSDYKVHVMIATHSPVIASDVPMECIIGLKYEEGVIEQYKPKDRTLGGDSSQLLLDVFELENLESIGALKSIRLIEKLLEQSQPTTEQVIEARKLYRDLSSTTEKYQLYKRYKNFLGE